VPNRDVLYNISIFVGVYEVEIELQLKRKKENKADVIEKNEALNESNNRDEK